jgi:hypothetical protein
MYNLTDEQLALEFNRGCIKAMAQIEKRFRPEIEEFARQVTQETVESEIITKRCFDTLNEMHKKFDTMPNIKARLFLTARNILLSYAKSVEKFDLN